jgi:predicted nucleic acid-binding protein
MASALRERAATGAERRGLARGRGNRPTAAVRLVDKYGDTPIDFPDATLVWLAEASGIQPVLTLDQHGFPTYRFSKSRRFKLVLDQ